MESLQNIVDSVSENVETDVKKLVEKEQEKSEGLNPQQWLAMSRKERRAFLKNHSEYFIQKKKASLDTWSKVIKQNVEFGNMKSKVVTENDVKINSEILEKKEQSYRSVLNSAGYSQELIDKKVDLWYSKVIKDGSFMIVK